MKTRLAADLGDDRALAAYEAMLRDVLEGIGPSADGLEVEVLWAPTEAANGESLRAAFGDRATAMQTGETLGDRMAMAFSERFFFHRTQQIIAIGVDEPQLTRETIEHAFALLDSCEWVVGPAEDGGYYLIGCRGPAFDVDVFDGIAWSTPTVFRDTMAKIRTWENSVAVLPRRFDVDVADDLRRLATECNDGGAVATLLREWGWR